MAPNKIRHSAGVFAVGVLYLLFTLLVLLPLVLVTECVCAVGWCLGYRWGPYELESPGARWRALIGMYREGTRR